MTRTLTGVVAIGLALVFMVVAASAVAPQSQRGQMTAAERSKRHDQIYSKGNKDQIDLMLARSVGDLQMPDYQTGPELYDPDPDGMLAALACNANAILVGSLRSSEVRLSADRGTIYTSWKIENLDTLKASALQSTPFRSTVEVLAQGGSIVRAGRKVTMPNMRLKGLSDDRRYLLFLILVPDTGAFRFWHGFDITTTKVGLVSARSLYPNLEQMTSETLLLKLRAAIPPQLGAPGCAQ